MHETGLTARTAAASGHNRVMNIVPRLGAMGLALVTVACGSPSANIDATPATADTSSSTDAASDAPSCVTLPSGALTRIATPMLHNGPEAYDFSKTGPRVVLKTGASSYRMWYEAVATNGLTTVGYATSSDGLSWTKMGIVLSPSAAWEGNEISPNSIAIVGTTMRLYYHGGGNSLPRRIGVATSTDGMSWTKQASPIVDLGANGAFDDVQVAEPRVFRVGATWRMYYTGRHGSNGQNSLGLATSSDGLVFTKQATPILDATRWGNFWGGAFFIDRGSWHLWRGVTNDNGATSSLYYASSTDGLSWTDGPNNPVLSRNTNTGAADYGFVGDSVSGYLDGSHYRIMYTGYNANLGGNQGRFEGICEAEIQSPCP